MEESNPGMLDGIAFIGDALGPLFYYDPAGPEAASTYEALATLDTEAAALEWPYASPEKTQAALRLMAEGLAHGIDDDLVWEYRRLFVGPATKATPPWGSVYTDRECVIFGEATLGLRAWMRANGIERMTDEREPEDHIGLMLMMLSWISTNKPALLDAFLADHLLTWSSHFLDEVEQATEHPFYEGLARLTRLSLEGIQTERGLVVEHPRFYR